MTSMGLDNSMIGVGGEMERGGELRRYMFAIELNGTIGTKTEKGAETSTTYTWKPENAPSMYKKVPSGTDSDEYDAIRQTLIVRRVILGPSAKDGEANWVSAECIDPDGSDTKFPLAFLSKGTETQTLVDLAFPDARDVHIKFTLEEGTGPVHIIGYHLIERIQFDNQGDDECEEEEEVDDEEADELAMLKEEKDAAPRKASSGSNDVGVRRLTAKRTITRDGNENGESGAAKKLKSDGDEAMEEATNGGSKK